MHADSTLRVNQGRITATRSYEGIESQSIVIAGGEVSITSSDDGINAAGDGTARMGQGTNRLEIRGGRLVIDAAGDGIDANGSIVMSDGVVIVNGPIVNNNAAVDYDVSFQLTGGFLLAAGSSGMAQTAGTNSTQPALLLTATTATNAGTMIHFETSAGVEVLSFAPTKRYQSVAFSSPALRTGTAYHVYVGGNSSGARGDGGLYQAGSYTAGTKTAEFTISSMVTRASF